MSSEAYVKLIKKIQGKIDDTHQKICSIEDTNLLSFLMLTINKVLHPIETEESLVKLEEIYSEINQLRGRIRSALDTYRISFSAEKSESQETRTKPETEDVENQVFFSSLLDLLEQVNFLEHELRRKDARYFASSGEDNNWEDLNLKF